MNNAKKKNNKRWKNIDAKTMQKIMDFSNGYMEFLNEVKTEREAVSKIIEMATLCGYKDINSCQTLMPGDKVYASNKGKSIYLAQIGEEELTNGFNCIGSHIDAPRLDLKQNPLYEDEGIALLKTHYYGGIKKYQWTTIPLALHGVIAKTDGSTVNIRIGEEVGEPIFLITDLLPHLAKKQEAKSLADGINGENLNIVIGSMPLDDENAENPVKANILNYLKLNYGMDEDDFRSAEIEVVPAFKAHSLGFDSSMVAAYGQDDRVCAYTSLIAMLESDKKLKKTAICIFSDKEEVGSMGNTGMESKNFELFMMDLLEKTGIVHPYALQRTFSASRALSADVTAGFDPSFPEVMEKNNASFLGNGVTIEKYTGARGKSGASDANAEFVAYVRGLFEKNKISYQSSEIGRVDEGGGGTIAYILADRGIEVLDCGVPLFSMHSPYETASKYDIYMAYKAYKVFLNSTK
ncbi:MAG: aminopeptidase [Eubacteriales bacterium]